MAGTAYYLASVARAYAAPKEPLDLKYWIFKTLEPPFPSHPSVASQSPPQGDETTSQWLLKRCLRSGVSPDCATLVGIVDKCLEEGGYLYFGLWGLFTIQLPTHNGTIAASNQVPFLYWLLVTPRRPWWPVSLLELLRCKIK